MVNVSVTFLYDIYVMSMYLWLYTGWNHFVFAVGLVLIEQATSPEASVNDKTVANR